MYISRLMWLKLMMEGGTGEEEGGEGFVQCTCNPTSDVALGDKGTGEQKRAKAVCTCSVASPESLFSLSLSPPPSISYILLPFACSLLPWFPSPAFFFIFSPFVSSAQFSLGCLLPCSHSTLLTL